MLLLAYPCPRNQMVPTACLYSILLADTFFSCSYLHTRTLFSCCTSHHDRHVARCPSSSIFPDCPAFSLVSCVGLWATPIMNGPRLLIAAFTTIYLVSAVKLLEGIYAVCLCFIYSIMNRVLKEPRLRKAHGQAYSKYLSAAPSNCKL